VVVGVNRFETEQQADRLILKVDSELRKEQIRRLEEVRTNRDGTVVDSALAALKEKASTNDNLIPGILECVEAYCSVGEISNVFRDVWGEYTESVVI
jgi:methylmalonyl-CoA mutase N-terminal domain/subunit